MVRIAVIGEGAIADTHMQSLSRIAGVEVVALVHGEATAGAAFANKWNIAATSPHLDAVLQRDDIDAVIVASPSALHPEHATRALDAGKHVLAEIPIGLDLASCEALAALAGSRPHQVAMAAHTRRFIQSHDVARARHSGLRVETQARIHLGRDTTGHHFENLKPETNQYTVHDGRQ